MITLLQDLNKENTAAFGGKATSLGAMMRSGIPVPFGYAMSADDYDDFLAFNHFPFGVGEYLEKSDKIVDFMLAATLPPQTEGRLDRMFDELIGLGPDKRLAVRSSAVCEDGQSQSMAGVFESHIDIESPQDLSKAVRKCYASMFQDRALAFMMRNELPLESLKMAVIVQVFIKGVFSGVLFTADTIEMDPDVFIINAIEGICADFVRGKKSALLFRLERASGRLLQSTIPDNAPLMDEGVLEALRHVGMRIERLFHSYQDIEWTIREGALYILRARPITTFRESRFPVSLKNDKDAEYTWFLDSPFPLTPLQQEICLRAHKGNNQGAYITGYSHHYVELMFQNGYIYYRQMEMRDAEEKRKTYSKKLMELFNEGKNVFQDDILVRLDEFRKKLDEYDRTASNPCEIARFIEDALDYLRQSSSLHWQAICGRGPIDSWTPDFQNTLKEYFEKKLGALSVSDYFDLIFRQSRLARSRELIIRMAELVRRTPELSVLFQEHPHDELLYPKLNLSEAGKTLLKEIERYIKEYGLISIDSFRNLTFPPLLRDRPSVVLGWIRYNLWQDQEAYENCQSKILRNKTRLIDKALAGLNEPEKRNFQKMPSLAEKAFLVSDDHAYHIDLTQWAYLNIALKSAGRCLSDKGRIERLDDVFFLCLDELNAMLRGADAVSCSEIEKRRSVFNDQKRMKPPGFLGKSPLRQEEKPEESKFAPAEVLKGVSGLQKKVRGTVRVPRGPGFSLIEKSRGLGDGHSCWIEPYLAKIAGLVYDGGSPFDHPGIIAREMDIPAIYYTRDATKRLKDGDVVELDGFSGEVRILN